MSLIRHVDHVAITVQDMARSVEFYTKKLGFSITRKAETPTTNIVFVGKGSAQLELFEIKEGQAKEVPPLEADEIGIKHIAFNVDDLESIVEEYRKKGVEFTSEIRRSGARSHIFFKDPDGIILQLLQG